MPTLATHTTAMKHSGMFYPCLADETRVAAPRTSVILRTTPEVLRGETLLIGSVLMTETASHGRYSLLPAGYSLITTHIRVATRLRLNNRNNSSQPKLPTAHAELNGGTQWNLATTAGCRIYEPARYHNH